MKFAFECIVVVTMVISILQMIKNWKHIKELNQNSAQSVLTYIVISNLITIIILNIILKTPNRYLLMAALIYVIFSVFYILYIAMYTYYKQGKIK